MFRQERLRVGEGEKEERGKWGRKGWGDRSVGDRGDREIETRPSGAHLEKL